MFFENFFQRFFVQNNCTSNKQQYEHIENNIMTMAEGKPNKNVK